MTNEDNILIKEKGSKGLVEKADDSSISIGICFDENLVGTNSIALTAKLKRNIYTLPDYHYCSFLEKWHLFSVPLNIGGKFEGCLTLASFGEPISDEMALITDLFSYKMTNELKNIRNKTDTTKSTIHLTKKQLNILKILASGKTGVATGMTMGISLGTVRYHKNNIFKKLNVESSTQAIIKAIKSGLLSLDDIDC